MDNSYIAAFFDAEGSGMVLTIRRQLKTGIIYRFRPVIKIAQKTTLVLTLIHNYVGYGHTEPGVYIINGLNGVISFSDKIAPYCLIKQEVLLTLSELSRFQSNHTRNTPYTLSETNYLIDLRDKVFSLNCLTRSNLKQKYPREVVLRDTTFVNTRDWQLKRSENGARALEISGIQTRFVKGEFHATHRNTLGS